jgi:hypothetical protein
MGFGLKEKFLAFQLFFRGQVSKLSVVFGLKRALLDTASRDFSYRTGFLAILKFILKGNVS